MSAIYSICFVLLGILALEYHALVFVMMILGLSRNARELMDEYRRSNKNKRDK
jgi:hypothetical protein